MTAVHTSDDLVLKYAVQDRAVQDRIEEHELCLRDPTSEEFTFIGAGADRRAYYDPQTNLVYKHARDLYYSPNLAKERESLDKAHAFLSAHPEFNVRYAETYFYTTASGDEYLVQEYVPTVGQRSIDSLFNDDYQSATSGAYTHNRGEETGLSEDYLRDNAGFDVETGMTVITDMLYAPRPRYEFSPIPMSSE